MTNFKSKLEDFTTEKLNKNQQKAVLGGGNDSAPKPPVDPGKGGGGPGTGNV